MKKLRKFSDFFDRDCISFMNRFFDKHSQLSFLTSSFSRMDSQVAGSRFNVITKIVATFMGSRVARSIEAVRVPSEVDFKGRLTPAK